jgi:hypothetical protein
MYRLGLQLALKGGREALVRLLLTAFAVAIGVTILLGVFAEFHAFQKTSNRPSWESTSGAPITSVPGHIPNAMLWNYSENIYKGQFIEQLDLAALGPDAPLLPGISKLPGPGQFYASPALSNLLKTVPKDELGSRFPGIQVGVIGQAALSFPNELAIYVGRAPAQFANLHGTTEVTQIATATQLQGTTNIYREAFGIAAIAILFPLLILINTATRLSASRREERYAAMRLVGATPHQINIIASVDALLGSLLGAVLGTVSFLLIRPAIADISFSGVRFFSNYVTLPAWAFIGVIVLVPIIAMLASLISLRRIQISPLGVSRKTSTKKPKAWGLIPLIAGVIMFPLGAINANGNKGGGPGLLFLGFLLILIGITLSGSWLTMRVTEVLARYASSASSLLAARRLSDNPKRAYRAVSGLVLAVFVGSVVSVLIPALNYAQNPTGQTSLSNVLRVPYDNGPGLSPQASAALVSKLQSYPETAVVPIYYNPAFLSYAFSPSKNGCSMQGRAIPCQNALNPQMAPLNSIVTCSSAQQLSILGTCPAGAAAVTLNSDDLLGGDNPLSVYKSLPAITSSSTKISANLKNLTLAGLLVKANSPSNLEQIRTYLTVYNSTMSQIGLGNGKGDNSLSAWQMGVFEPETIGEVAAIRNNDGSNVGRVVLAVVALTLITAGCSLAVTVGGSLVERKRSFTLLRVSGVSLRTLSITVLLIAASILAAGIGLGAGIPTVKILLKNVLSKNTTVPVHPSAGYYITLGLGLVIALCLVAITLPILSRMTMPEEARFE